MHRRPWAFFDLDGCLVDSRSAIAHCINHAITQLGLPEQPSEALHRYIGPPLRQSFVTLLREAHANVGLADLCVAVYRARYRSVCVQQTRPVPGIHTVLSELFGRVSLMLVTTKPLEFARPIIRGVGLEPFFEEVFAPSLEATSEPKTVTLRRALSRLGLAPVASSTAMCMVGDRWHDIEAGQHCGLSTVGVTWGVGNRAELEAAGATVILDEPRFLPRVLLSDGALDAGAAATLGQSVSSRPDS